jgi:dolichyl-phosphate beta-glucosyltransferase
MTCPLSVIIPAYNESRRLPATLEQVDAYLGGRFPDAEVVVVDDGSRDGTVDLARAFGASHPRVRVLSYGCNRGKGYAVRVGMLAGVGERLLFSDADMSTPIEEVEKLMARMDQGHDIVIGSRALPESAVEVHQPWYREGMGRGFNVLVQVLAVKGIKDTQCGFKLFSRAAAQDLFSRAEVDRFAFDVELLVLARGRWKVAETPVRWLNSEDTRVSAGRDAARMALDLLFIRARHLLKS